MNNMIILFTQKILEPAHIMTHLIARCLSISWMSGPYSSWKAKYSFFLGEGKKLFQYSISLLIILGGLYKA